MKKRGARLVLGSDHSLSTNIDYDTHKQIALKYSIIIAPYSSPF